MILMIGEKPNVGKAISTVVGADKVQKGYTESNGYIVSLCVGHLVGLKFPNDYGNGWDQKKAEVEYDMIRYVDKNLKFKDDEYDPAGW